MYSFDPIGTLSTIYKEKFGIPRQSGLVASEASLELSPRFRDATRGLEGFSHLWLITVFHAHIESGWNALVRPPRLGGKDKVGVFSSRAPHRPNPIGLSVVELLRVENRKDGSSQLFLRGADLLDGTPVLDIKPYIPYADSIPHAHEGWNTKDFARLRIIFSPEASDACEILLREGYANLKEIIRATLELDPRPAFQSGEAQPAEYGMAISDFNVRFRVEKDQCKVFEIAKVEIQSKA